MKRTLAISMAFLTALAALTSVSGCGGSTDVVYENPGQVLQPVSVDVTPSRARLGDQVVVSVEMESQYQIAHAEIDMSALGGSATVNFVDNGVAPDQMAGDNIFTAAQVLGASVNDGSKSLAYTFRDSRDYTYSGFVTMLVDSNTPGVSNFNLAGQNLERGIEQAFRVDVDSIRPLTSVTLDLSSIGLSSTLAMHDDGIAPDLLPGDGSFAAAVTIAGNIPAGVKNASVTATADSGSEGMLDIAFEVVNAVPVIDQLQSGATNMTNAGSSEAAPGDDIQLVVFANDGDNAQVTVTMDLSGIGGVADQMLNWDFMLQAYTATVTIDPATIAGTHVLPVTATDANSASSTSTIDLVVRNWEGIGGSATAHGLSDSLGWSLGSACVSDAAGRIYVAYSRRVNVPITVKSNGWMYAVYLKMYDPITNTWSGLSGSDSGYGLNLTSGGSVITNGFMGDIRYYAQTQQGMANKEGIYVTFHGDPDPDAGDTLWDSFLVRWNITDQQWEALGTGIAASDYVDPMATDGVDDVGGFSQSGNRAQEPRVAFDSATDNVYVTYHDRDAGGKYNIRVRRFVTATGLWEEFNGATPLDGISDDNTENFKNPQIAINGGFAYVAYINGSSDGDILVKRGDLSTNTWSLPVKIHDAATSPDGGAYPAIAIDGLNNIWVSFRVTDTTNGTDQQVHVVTAPIANWSTAASWTGAGNGSRNVAISPSTSSSSIRTRLVVDSMNRVLTVFNQEHPGMTGTSRNVYVARWEANAWRGVAGSLQGDGITSYPNETDWLPWICVTPNGTPVVSWDTFWGTGSGNDRRKVYVKMLK